VLAGLFADKLINNNGWSLDINYIIFYYN